MTYVQAWERDLGLQRFSRAMGLSGSKRSEYQRQGCLFPLRLFSAERLQEASESYWRNSRRNKI